MTFLGTSGAIPTVDRDFSGIYVDSTTQKYLLDLGEGTVRQMARFSMGLDVAAVFIIHQHADHILGLPVLLLAMELDERIPPLDVFTPKEPAPISGHSSM